MTNLRRDAFPRPFLAIFFCGCFLMAMHPGYSQIGNESLGTGAGISITSGDYNVFIGDSSGTNMSSGSHNSFLGYRSGFSSTNSSDNTFIGRDAGYSNTTGADNTFVGARAGMLSTATDNTFIGSEAGYVNTTGTDNTFVGEQAGYENTSGSRNVFVGEDAGYRNSTGYDNTFLGRMSGRTNTTGYRNTYVGNESGYDSEDGHHNTAVGDSSLTDNSSGTHNTSIGAASLAATEYGSYNTAVGAYAGWDNNRTNDNNNANRNTYLGAFAGYSNRRGEDNVGIGARADFNNTDRSRTTFIGADALAGDNDVVAIGYHAEARGIFSILVGGESSTTTNGDRSIAIGYDADIAKQNSIAIGYNTDVSGTNSVAIGYQSQVNVDNEVYLGNVTTSAIGGIVNWSATSDKRFKKDVSENVPGLVFIDLLRPVTYHFDAEKMAEFEGYSLDRSLRKAALIKAGIRYSGFLAQDVQEAAESLGFEFSGVKVPANPETEAYGLRYAEFVVPLVKATQELHAIIQKQDQQLATQADINKSQEAKLAAYQQLLAELGARISILEAQASPSNHPSKGTNEVSPNR